MQGKGIVKFFLVVMTLVVIVQYIFILPTNQVEKKADQYAEDLAASYPEEEQRMVKKEMRAKYLDSMSNEVIFKIPLIKDFTYQELKSRQLALGLDLKGGMSVVMQVDLRDFIRSLATGINDPTFEEALDKASEAQKNAQSDYVTLFADAYNEVTNGEGQLARLFATNPALREEINFETSNAEVVRILREKANETVDLTFKRLKDRIDEFGVTQPNVSLDAARHLIVVELPGVDNPERARQFLQTTAKLEFWDVYRLSDEGIASALQATDDKLRTLMADDTSAQQMRYDTTYQVARDTNGNPTGDSTMVIDTLEAAAGPGPLFSIFQPNVTQEGMVGSVAGVIGMAERNNRDKVMEYLTRDEIRSLFPPNLKWMWTEDPVVNFQTGEVTDFYELYAIKTVRGKNEAPLGGDHIIRSDAYPDPQTGEVAVNLSMDSEGARIWRDMTERAAADNNRQVAIALDDKVVSAPRVQEPIAGGDTRITGNFSLQEGQDLSSILEIGKLPAKPEIIHEAFVGPSLGAENISRSINALLIGFGLVLAFMIFYYGGAGIVSILALFLNLLFIFGALASYGTVLTLPGIAGIVLTIGMAVDANVIIFERVREELREGKSLLMSINDGFKNSYSAIIDANVTTILVAIILAYFGLGPIKGFAVVLIIGVLCSLFTAVLVGRLMIDWWTGSRGKHLSFWTGSSKNAFANVNIDWIGKRKIAYMISGFLIVASIASFVFRGFELGVDFKGGYSYNVEIMEEVDAQELRATLSETFGMEPIVKAVNTENTFNVVTSYKINETGEEIANEVQQKLYDGIVGLTGSTVSYDNFSDPDSEGTRVISSSKVGPTIADDIKTSAFYAGIFALLLIFLYIFLRFSKPQYSLGAVAALFHDSIIVMGLFSILSGIVPFSLEIDQAFIAALLTVIGYSINDTVVVFDRIREYLNSYTSKSKEEVINMAVNSTISRTIITSLTTLFVVAVLFVFGGTSIRGFAFALLVGIVVGTYSSVFVATPIMSDLSGDLEAKGGKEDKKRFSKKAAAAR